MPCDSVTTQSVNLANAEPSILADALRADGWIFDTLADGTICAYSEFNAITWQAGKGLTLRGGSESQNERTLKRVTQAYSRQAVTWAAQRAGWTVKTTGQNTLAVSRR